MLSAMEVLALIFGVVISWRWIPPYIHHILLVIYWLRYRTEFKFGVMYGVTDGYRTYAALLDTVKVADYAEYLRLHNAAQASSYGLFRRYYDDIVNFLLTTLLPIVFFTCNCLLDVLVCIHIWSGSRVVKPCHSHDVRQPVPTRFLHRIND